MNLAGKWEKGFAEPMWVISDQEPELALSIYILREQIDESFRDLKSLLNLNKIMNKKRTNMEKMVALILLAYAIGLLVGETVRDYVYGGGRKWMLYSGLFILLKHKLSISRQVKAQIMKNAFLIFRRIILGDVRIHVL